MGNHTPLARLNRGERPARALRLMVLLGTRPEAVKVAPIVLAARAESDCAIRIVSSGQHPRAMLEVFGEFGIAADADLALFRQGQTLADIFQGAMAGFATEIEAWQPDVVIVQGDTTSALAGALTAFYAGVPVAHIEAGLRTDNLAEPYPEEMNRRAIDTFADFLFAPTPNAALNLLSERSRRADIVVTGNTVIDAALEVARIRSRLTDVSPLVQEAWNNGFARRVLVTVHRRESWGADLDSVAAGIIRSAERFPTALFVVPLHPNPIVRRSFRHDLPPNILVTEPLPYGPFVKALSEADLVITDSGGVLEEATSFGTHVLVVRRRTERPEAVDAGLADLIGVDSGTIEGSIVERLTRPSQESESAKIFGDGHAGKRIVTWLRWRFGFVARRMLPFTPDVTSSDDGVGLVVDVRERSER